MFKFLFDFYNQSGFTATDAFLASQGIQGNSIIKSITWQTRQSCNTKMTRNNKKYQEERGVGGAKLPRAGPASATPSCNGRPPLPTQVLSQGDWPGEPHLRLPNPVEQHVGFDPRTPAEAVVDVHRRARAVVRDVVRERCTQ